MAGAKFDNPSFMKFFFLAFCLTLVYIQASHAQFNDNFSDNDLTANPVWQGDVGKFIVNDAQQLELNSSGEGTSYLSSGFSSPLDDIEWQFYIKQGFSSSASNYGKVYLASDSSTLTGPLQGYYLQFGEAGSNDAIELFRQTGLNLTSVCRGKNGSIASAFQVRVKVLRNTGGNWEIYTDYTGGADFSLEASGVDMTHQNASFLGIFCANTKSNATNFFFDDFSAGLKQVDTTPPSVQSMTLMSSSEVDILFSEKIQPVEAEALSNYFATEDLDHPERAELQPDQKTVKLFFKKDFPEKIQCSLTIAEEKDMEGNEMISITEGFMYIRPVSTVYKDVILTEIFADPSPQIGLPNAEFVEIFNRSASPVDLTNWKFTDGSSTGILSSKVIAPGNYLILTSTANASVFTAYSNVMSLSNFPTLNNSGDAIVLKDANENNIDSVNYSDTWYRDDDKKEGGWSLELIDPMNTCAESENWTASEDVSGGTPGRENSVMANKPDLLGPKLVEAFAASFNSVTLKFNEKLEKKLPAIENFTLFPAGVISTIGFTDASLTSFSLLLKDSIQHGVLYSIVARNLYDCAGNKIQNDFSRTDFSLPEAADSLDIIVNEVLFNPRPTGVDFVEIYNNSTKFINLKNWSIANMIEGEVHNSKTIVPSDHVLYPASYAVLTENGDILKGEYPNAHEDALLKMTNLPAFDDDAGSVVLLNEKNKIVDYFSYTKAMHATFIKDEEGVSLERITFNASTNDPQNWSSASSIAGYATPGYLNSSARNENVIPEESVKVDPEIFVPIAGQPDFTQIKYNFDQGNYVGNVKILDTQGHEIKRLANNEVLSMQGSFRWDGDRDNGGKARVGYYVVRFEIFDLNGMVKTFHKRVIVATKF